MLITYGAEKSRRTEYNADRNRRRAINRLVRRFRKGPIDSGKVQSLQYLLVMYLCYIWALTVSHLLGLNWGICITRQISFSFSGPCVSGQIDGYGGKYGQKGGGGGKSGKKMEAKAGGDGGGRKGIWKMADTAHGDPIIATHGNEAASV